MTHLRRPVPLVLALSLLGLAAASSCRKSDGSSAEPGAEDSMLGLDAGSGSGEAREKRPKVPIKCITDPGDPSCEALLGYERKDGTLSFVGDTCRQNVCHGFGDCSLDAEGSVECLCDEGYGGLNCEKKRKAAP